VRVREAQSRAGFVNRRSFTYASIDAAEYGRESRALARAFGDSRRNPVPLHG